MLIGTHEHDGAPTKPGYVCLQLVSGSHGCRSNETNADLWRESIEQKNGSTSLLQRSSATLLVDCPTDLLQQGDVAVFHSSLPLAAKFGAEALVHYPNDLVIVAMAATFVDPEVC